MRQTRSNRLLALGLLAIAPALAAVAPLPSAAVSGLTTGSADPTAPLLAAVALAAWACTAWLLLVAAVTCADQLPGAAGRAARCASSWIAPTAVRTLVRVAVGTSVAASVFVGPAALAADRAPAPAPAASATPDLDWPTVEPVWSLPTPPAAPTAPATDPLRRPGAAAPADVVAVPTGQGVVVQAGDSLWSIAAQALGPGVTDRQVAQAWPQWWSANRTVLGDDPDLIHPGTHLSTPQP